MRGIFFIFLRSTTDLYCNVLQWIYLLLYIYVIRKFCFYSSYSDVNENNKNEVMNSLSIKIFMVRFYLTNIAFPSHSRGR